MNKFIVILSEPAYYGYTVEAEDARAAGEEALRLFYSGVNINPYDYGQLTVSTVEPVEYSSLPAPKP
jgi:hypothetical protein